MKKCAPHDVHRLLRLRKKHVVRGRDGHDAAVRNDVCKSLTQRSIERRQMRPRTCRSLVCSSTALRTRLSPPPPRHVYAVRFGVKMAFVEYDLVELQDGFALSPSQEVAGLASRALWLGETFDAEFAPNAPGTDVLRMRKAKGDVVYPRSLTMVR